MGFDLKKMFSSVTNQATGGVQQAVDQAVGGVQEAVGGGFFSNLIMSPFRAVANFAKGVWGSLWNGAIFTAGITAVKLVAPELWRFVAGAIGGKAAQDKAAARAQENGISGVILDSALEGFGVAAAIGGAGGMISGASGRGVAGMLGTGLVMAGVAAVTIGAIHKNGIKEVADSDTGGKQPPATPTAKTKAEPAKG